MESYDDPFETIRNTVVAISDSTLPFSQTVAQKLAERRIQLVLGTSDSYNGFVAEMEKNFKPFILPVSYQRDSREEAGRFFEESKRYFTRFPGILIHEFHVPPVPLTVDKDLYAFEQAVQPYKKLAEVAANHSSKVILVTPVADPRVLRLEEELALTTTQKVRELFQRQYEHLGIQFRNFLKGYEPLEIQVQNLLTNHVLSPNARQSPQP
ncbi:hypothetical protein HYV81_02300 [Candidatus Woesearchaeota archaeon]|nr:hypothetical protein [Candidatus Woesearchaeota archaeon]